ncbi:MAG: exodeoxyribonuclease VII small subunit [Paludibacteraceae bacterium]|nr:exodeoxyribonuclease VII small subunit [Paludibacteraceae bacterium]MBO7637246.1 exodeoxyribonuclease VII small subunit [Paludibacteraceae bacterium]MBR5973385.1 exodeoxyribonuclease VII small subunit [Paludibacteraceae bacterium]
MGKIKDYKSAITELEEILSQLEANDLEIDELTTKAKRATELIKYCKDKLYKTTEEVNSILEEK